jgi:pheromone shutdown protein TraB
MIEFVACPEPGCDAAAEITARWVWSSTDGPLEHVKTSCVNGHHRSLLTASLVSPAISARVVYRSARWN